MIRFGHDYDPQCMVKIHLVVGLELVVGAGAGAGDDGQPN